MRLRDSFITRDVDDAQFMISTDDSFTGIARSNETAAFIINLLKTETTKEQIVEAMLKEYDAPRETIEKDVGDILNTLRRIGALEE